MKPKQSPIFTLFAWISTVLLQAAAFGGPAEDHFESKVRPVLVETCFRCHGDTKTAGALRLDSRDALMKGGDSGPAIVPGNPDESLLIQAIRRQEDVSAMPPGKDKILRPDQVEDFAAWVKAGAVWPEGSPKFRATKHWAFEPPRPVPPPSVRETAWVRNPIDAFILARQEAKGVRHAPSADRLTLIRRATFDLTGLPPTPDEIDRYLNDPSSDAFEKVVDRLLSSRAYGERWGRHWLDVVRYADTAGETADFPVPLAYHYRDYVINALNADKPYDEFLREQIAGDILAEQGPPDRHAERAAATGYLAISRRFGFDSENYHHLTIQDTIDTVGQSVLGLSLGCARCHDHKFDPVSMGDYYGLYGILDSTRYAFPGSEQKQKVRAMLPLPPKQDSERKWREHRARIAELSARVGGQEANNAKTVILRSLHDIDGDFELQAPAAGGSNGVLVPPWFYEGLVSMTNGAQSPYRNLYPPGKVGVGIPSRSGPYRFHQALHFGRIEDREGLLHLNLDFRVAGDADARGEHGFSLGSLDGTPAFAILLSSKRLAIRTGDSVEEITPIKPNTWTNLQGTLDLKRRSLALRVNVPGSRVETFEKRLSASGNLAIESVEFHSRGAASEARPAIDFDNLGIQEAPIQSIENDSPNLAGNGSPHDVATLKERLNQLAGLDGDFEQQSKDSPPSAPWNAGPNSVVKSSSGSQSPFRNIFSAGELGMHMPNRREYDGLGLSLPNPHLDPQGRIHVSFDFRCGKADAGGDGSWRYYLGHGAGNSAAVELHFNGGRFFRRAGDSIEPVAPLRVGTWYQVQVTLDTKARTYAGTFSSASESTNFGGKVANGWDGGIDYTFVDSYGHIGGVRPSLDLDNFTLGDHPIPPLKETARAPDAITSESRRREATEIRKQLDRIERDAVTLRKELDSLITEVPFAMTYGVVEGTPHNVRIQMRGEPDKPGPEVPRGFIKALGGEPLPLDSKGSGRLELARWLTSSTNTLTARVMVNRIWQFHFGRGLVGTPNDFGLRGQLPTHPELLDYLASEFVRSGWSVKSMHRLIMSSATYHQSSEPSASTLASPGNAVDTYASFPRRRMSAEEIRDSILAVSGELDRSPGREHPFAPPSTWGYSQHAPFAAVYDHDRRSIYLMTQRLKRHPFLALFDGADPNTTTPLRLITTVPTQSLFFLNDPFVHEKSEKWAARLTSSRSDDASRIQAAWRLAIGRVPTPEEEAEALAFLSAYRAESSATNRGGGEVQSLAAYLRILMSSNLFLYLD